MNNQPWQRGKLITRTTQTKPFNRLQGYVVSVVDAAILKMKGLN